MVAQLGDDDTCEPPRIECPSCAGTMRLVRVTPRLGADPELHTFRCVECGDVVTQEKGMAE